MTYIGYLFIVDSIHFMFSGLFSFQQSSFVTEQSFVTDGWIKAIHFSFLFFHFLVMWTGIWNRKFYDQMSNLCKLDEKWVQHLHINKMRSINEKINSEILRILAEPSRFNIWISLRRLLANTERHDLKALWMISIRIWITVRICFEQMSKSEIGLE